VNTDVSVAPLIPPPLQLMLQTSALHHLFLPFSVQMDMCLHV